TEFGLVADRVEVVIPGDDVDPGRVLPQCGGHEATGLAAVDGVLFRGEGVDAGDLIECRRARVERQRGLGVAMRGLAAAEACEQDATSAQGVHGTGTILEGGVEYPDGLLGAARLL